MPVTVMGRASGRPLATCLLATFTTILAEHIRRSTGWDCVEAADGMPVLAGRVHLARGDYHMRVTGTAAKPVLKLDQGPQENFCRPSVEPMMRSIIEIWGGRVLAVILTGIGHDGQRAAPNWFRPAAPSSPRTKRPAWCGECRGR